MVSALTVDELLIDYWYILLRRTVVQSTPVFVCMWHLKSGWVLAALSYRIVDIVAAGKHHI